MRYGAAHVATPDDHWMGRLPRLAAGLCVGMASRRSLRRPLRRARRGGVSRLCNAQPLRRALRTASDADLAVIVSDRVYTDWVRSGRPEARPELFRQANIQEKEHVAPHGWVPGADAHGLDLADSTARTRSPARAANAAEGWPHTSPVASPGWRDSAPPRWSCLWRCWRSPACRSWPPHGVRRSRSPPRAAAICCLAPCSRSQSPGGTWALPRLGRQPTECCCDGARRRPRTPSPRATGSRIQAEPSTLSVDRSSSSAVLLDWSGTLPLSWRQLLAFVLFAGLCAVAWLTLATRDTVRRAAEKYAHKLYAPLETLSTRSSPDCLRPDRQM